MRRILCAIRIFMFGILLLGGSSLVIIGIPAYDDQTTQAQDPASKPDNTKVNKRDRDRDKPTAGQQKENRSDRETARRVRRAIVKDKSLSSYAHNVKVIVRDGAVTLRGPVRSEQEKEAVEAKAAEVVGKEKVKNEIEVAPKKK